MSKPYKEYWIRCDKHWNTIAEGSFDFITRKWYSLVYGNKFIKVRSWEG